MTVLPLTGWTMRGGMAVSCALIHNSQNPLYGQFGYKWLVSYQSWLTKDGAGNMTIHWDNGQSYPFNINGGGYNQPLGINQTLTYNGSDNSYDIATQGKTRFHFTALSGLWFLSSISDINNNTLTITRTNGLVSTVSDQANPPRTLTYSYDGNGHLASVTDPLGRQWAMNYVSGSSYLASVQLPSVAGQSYSLQLGYGDGRQNLTYFQSARGAVSRFTYNGDNSLASSQDALGNQTNFAYTASSTVITDPNGHTTTHAYSAGLLASVTDALGLAESYGYDWDYAQNYKKDRRLNAWTTGYAYKPYTCNITAATSTDPLKNISSSTADAYGKPLTQTDALGNVTKIIYDGSENPTETDVTGTDGVVRKSYIGGYTSGLPTTYTDANGHSSSVAYDGNGWGYAVSATNGNNIATRATFNALGWKFTGTDALNRVTRYTYDAWGRLTVVTAPDGTQTSTIYDPDGGVQCVLDADAYAAAPLYAVHCGGGAVGRFSADAYGSGGYVFTTASAVDTNGVADPAPAALYQTERAGSFTYAFPGLTPGRLYTLRLHFAELSRNGPGLMQFNAAVNGAPALANYDPWAAGGGMFRASVVEYIAAADGGGQMTVSFTSGAGDVPTCSGIEVLPFVHTVANNYDADDRLVSTFGGTGTGNGDVVSYAYDGTDPVTGASQRGLLSSKTDGNGNTTRYAYSPRNEAAATFYADGTAESVTYDENGSVRTRTKADGKVIRYAYDADSRLSDITYPSLPAVHFDYDVGGRRTHMHDGSGDTTWTYGDGLHLTHLSSGRGDVFYDYYLTGPRWHMTAPGVNPSSSLAAYVYTYDPGLRLTGLTSPFGEKTTFAYNDDGTLQKKTLANGGSISYWYDPASAQMTDLQFATPAFGSSYSHHYTYTPAGSLASRSESDGATNSFAYDGINQLVREVRSGGGFDRAYTYDHNGNRLTQTQNGALVQQFSYDAHDKLTGGINESESYDANGNLTVQTVNGQTTRFGWDDEDRLAGQTFPDGHSDTYTYTGLGMRLTKTDPTGGYAYFADGVSPASPVLSDGRTSFTPGLSETHGTGNNTYASVFYLADAQGNSRGLLDGAQNNTDGYNWDAFGNSVSRLGTNPTAYAWNEESGYQSDGDSGLKLLGHRYYDSRTGRFLSQDPAGDGDNWYGYADNDPMDEDDPSGLDPKYLNPDGSEYVPDDGGSVIDPSNGNIDTGVSSIHSSGGASGGPNALTGMFNQPYSPGEVSFYTGLTRGIDLFTFGTYSGLNKAAASQNGVTYAKALVPFGAAMMSNVVGGGEASAARGVGGWITKDVFSTLEQKVGAKSLKQFVAALKKGEVGPKGESGIKELKSPVRGFTHELKIGGGGSRILGKMGEWNGKAMYIFSELSGHLKGR